MALIDKSVQISKESDEVLAAVQALVVGLLVEKKKIADVLVSVLPLLLSAADGLDKVGAEWKDEKAGVLKALALRLADIIEEMGKPKA